MLGRDAEDAMEEHTTTKRQYVLGSHAEELERLDRQAMVIERPTRLLLHAAGLAPGMRVLDLGTGLGHVARLAGELVGASGAVVGIDQSRDALAVARQRAQDAGATHFTYEEADVTRWRAPEPFDAIVGRLVLFHVPDPAAVVAHHLQNLRPGGLFVAIDFDIGGARSDPSVPLLHEVVRWIEAAFRAAGAWPRIGARLGTILKQSGLERVATFGVAGYLSPDDPSGPAFVSGVVRSLAAAIVRHGIATDEQLNLGTLEQRIADSIREAGAVLLPPTVVGAWGYKSK
jgi:ubiquinone/menaquinone biosynthesis C-methylase UbiE